MHVGMCGSRLLAEAFADTMAVPKRVLLKCFLLLTLLVVVYPPLLNRMQMKSRLKVRNASPCTIASIKHSVSSVHLNISLCFRSNLSETQFGNLLTESLESEKRRTSEPTFHRQLKQTSAMPKERSNLANASDGSMVAVSPTTPKISDSSRKTIRTYGDIPQLRVRAVNCGKLMMGDQCEQEKADIYQTQCPKIVRSDKEIYSEALNCSKFLSDCRYIRKPVSEEEAKFPISYSILLFKDVEQFERLLRAIYRPQNFYCIHVDKKSEKSVQDAVGAIVECLENAFMAPEQFDVKWGTFTVLAPELSCMTELLKYKKWKYFINLTGQEFPLKTNWEIIEILKIFNGSNNIEGTIKGRNLYRTANAPPAPFNMTITKGSVHIVATRGYVEYLIYNDTSIKLLEWVKQTQIPDETYFSTLNYNPQLQVPGSYLGEPETGTNGNLFITRFKNWGGWPCAGKRVRDICTFAVRDLPLLATRVELFANKFHIDYEPLALDCIEELHYNRTRTEILNGPNINRTFYENLDFVRNHI